MRLRNVYRTIRVSSNMRKIAPVLLTLLFAPFLFASDADNAVMQKVFLFTAHSNHMHGVAPAVVREKTLGGADSFATQWIKKTSGDVIGGELAASYEKQNADEEDVNDFFPKLVKTVKADVPYDWTKINEQFPAANALMVFSRPAFDSLGTTAIVRADVIPKNGQPTTTFFQLEHQPDDSWKIGLMAKATYDGARHTDIHLSAR